MAVRGMKKTDIWDDSDVRQSLGRMQNEFPALVAQALAKEAEKLGKEIKKTSPRDTGELQESVVVDDPEVKHDGITVRVAQETDYGATVHELFDQSNISTKKNPNAKAKWFGKAVAKKSATFLKDLGSRASDILDGIL